MSVQQYVGRGLRTLIRKPGFSVPSILTLALACWAMASIFAVINAVYLNSLPYPDADELVEVTGYKSSDRGPEEWPLSYLDLEDLRDQSRQMVDVIATSPTQSFNLTYDGQTERVKSELVSAGYFEMLGVVPALGRAFAAAEDEVGSGQLVAVVSNALWRQRFDGGREAVGRSVEIAGHIFEIIGVAPAGFRGVTDQADIWLPVTSADRVLLPHFIQERDSRWLTALGRLAPGVSLQQAQAEAESIAVGLQQQFTDTNEGNRILVTPLAEAWFGEMSSGLYVILGGAFLVLLIAGFNVASLFFVRAVAQRGEMAMKASLGATRLQLLAQPLAESVLGALLGGALGLLLAHSTIDLLVSMSGVNFRSFVEVAVDLRVVLVLLACFTVLGLLLALVPARIVSRTQLSQVFRQGGRGTATGFGRLRFQSYVIMIQIAVALAVTVCTGLAVKGLSEFLRSDLGFEPQHLLTLRAELSGEAFPGNEERRIFVQQVVDQARALPGVTNAAIVGPGLSTDGWYGSGFTLENWQDVGGDGMVQMLRHQVTPGYFQTLGIPLLEGRDFSSSDRPDTMPVAVISQAGAKRHWPSESALGRKVKFGPPDGNGPWFTIVGVAGDVSHQGRSTEKRPAPDLYLSIIQFPPGSPPIFNVVIRSETALTENFVSQVREQVQLVSADVPLYDIASMEQRLKSQTTQGRFLVLLMAICGTLALLLVSVGIYGVISYSVSQSQRAIGIRMALGAERSSVLKMVVGRGLYLAVVGIGIGLLLTFGLTRLLGSMLYGLRSADLGIFAMAIALLFLVTAFAAYFPARRALRVEPMSILREE